MPRPRDAPPDDVGPERVLVYGTLKRGGRLHHHAQPARFVEGRTVEGLVLLDTGHGYPAAVAGGGRVRGEVLEVPPATLALLDRLEGVPERYVRARFGDAWVYVWRGEPPRRWTVVEGGDWPVEDPPGP